MAVALISLIPMINGDSTYQGALVAIIITFFPMLALMCIPVVVAEGESPLQDLEHDLLVGNSYRMVEIRSDISSDTILAVKNQGGILRIITPHGPRRWETVSS